MASGQYTKSLELAVASGVLWTSGTIRVLLVDSSYAYDPDHATVADVIADELGVSGYARATLASKTTTLVTTISVTPGDCTGWTTTSVAVPVVFTSAISAGLAVGTYNVEIVGTYVNGSVRWPENGSALSLVVRAPGAT